MEFSAAQREMSGAYVGGAAGVLVSGLVWLIAGFVAIRLGDRLAFTALFIGGMIIWPASLVIARAVFAAPKLSRANPLDRLGLESTFVLFAGLLLAYCLLRTAPGLALSAVAVTIGARYFLFRTLYGEPLYCVLGAAIAVIGGVAALGMTPLPVNIALVVGVIEIGFSMLLLLRWKRRAGQA